MASSSFDQGTSTKRKVGGSSRTDPAWEHAKPVENKPRNLICIYCRKEFTGGAFRFKHHLACTHKDVEPCLHVPDEVKNKFRDILHTRVQAREQRRQDSSSFGIDEYEPDSGSIPKKQAGSFSQPWSQNAPTSSTSTPRTHSTINTWLKKDLRNEAAMNTSWFIYENAIPFNVVRSTSFATMCESIARHGAGYKPTTYHEVRETHLKQAVSTVQSYIEEHKIDWKRLGCSIMSDGWTDTKKRSILNFMVNSPKGTVFIESVDASDIVKDASTIFGLLDKFVDKIGEENIVQVITDNASNYIKAGELLMEKRKHLYWMPCQAHCLDLILEDFEKKLPLHKSTIARGRKITNFIYGRTLLLTMLRKFTKGRELIRPAMTRFATSYLTIGCLFELKANVLSMFASSGWKTSRFASMQLGKEVERIVVDNEFWADVKVCLKAAFPLIKVLRLVDSDVQPAMPFMYEAVQNAQEAIKKNYNNVKKSYGPILDIVNERWLNKMIKPLHVVAFYLNPRVVYKEDFKESYDVKKAWYDVCERIVCDVQLIGKMDYQLNDFKNKLGLFGKPAAMVNLHKMPPAIWWTTYGDSVPELQQFAVRILSLTCSSSGCERNWSAFERVHTKKRNRLSQQKMNDLVYVMYNMKLRDRKPREIDDDDTYSIPSDNEWVADDEGADEDYDADDEIEALNLDTTQARINLEDMEFHDEDGDDEEEATESRNLGIEIYGDVGGTSAGHGIDDYDVAFLND